jgi:hypothetical protein
MVTQEEYKTCVKIVDGFCVSQESTAHVLECGYRRYGDRLTVAIGGPLGSGFTGIRSALRLAP